MEHAKIKISDFSEHLFWDVDKTELNIDKDYKFIIKKVLNYGLLSDFILVKKQYGLTLIADVAITVRELDRKTMSFISLITNTPFSKFICYNTKQLTQKHWNF